MIKDEREKQQSFIQYRALIMMKGAATATKCGTKQLIDITFGSSDAEVKVLLVKIIKDKKGFTQAKQTYFSNILDSLAGLYPCCLFG